jgi:CHAD domain-containing protein
MKAKRIWRDDLDLRSNLQQRLPKLARKYLKKGTDALNGDRSWDEIHRFRLDTKRFRYTLELFVNQYGPGLDAMLDQLRHIQKLLGEANDNIVTSEMLRDIPGTDGVRDKLAKRAANRLKKLRIWWRNTLMSEAAQEQWIRYLSRYAARPGVKRSSTPLRQAAKSTSYTETRIQDNKS